ncbi:DNA polymerase thumb domain-containing protein [Acholeplasma laidlawii]|uniref:ImpB/MucB/SamB family protein likely of prophage origin n=2 Tax=Acholeplasma laidlawii TaxID=2148 RepID=A9NHN3_ACHLI|nr:DNA damage repair protein [Acholeplasma laidlawii]ABX81863.1 ImpB/MucB/SamB family protein likely of prophage origin [Acholeplasma laidlawii PG-8A]NWH10849.1 damage repair protein [Acholeplasma laidlawii]NWH12234.1 damage repair protein [Acholeplasma laidlawii]NWH13620.1 damage repair protein [Acholeplasma laidlawii]NWH14213.1 damage repair protein [Acholeplasma laidlawii]
MEDLQHLQVHRNIICIDFKFFYASVEYVLRGLDPFTTPLVVADRSRGKDALCLAVSPYLKSMEVPGRIRIFDIPDNLKEGTIYAMSRMKTYMEYTMKVIEIYLIFVSEDDLYVYSIDEAFLDLTGYLKLYNKTELQLTKEIIKKITDEPHLPVSVGIGPNILMAKLSMDIDSKKQKDSIAKWSYKDIPDRLWPVEPLSKMWGIGPRMEINLNKLGIWSIGDLAAYNVDALQDRFGVMGQQLWYHAHGIDNALIQDKGKLRYQNKSYGMSQVLFHDYNGEEVLTIIQEMVDEVSRRLRLNKKRCRVIHFGIGYNADIGGGLHQQITFDQPTSSVDQIFETCLNIFKNKYDGFPIRTVEVSLGGLTESTTYQYSIFEDAESIDREYNLMSAMDEIKEKFGKNAVNRATALNKESTIIKHNTFIGRHKA